MFCRKMSYLGVVECMISLYIIFSNLVESSTTDVTHFLIFPDGKKKFGVTIAALTLNGLH